MKQRMNIAASFSFFLSFVCFVCFFFFNLPFVQEKEKERKNQQHVINWTIWSALSFLVSTLHGGNDPKDVKSSEFFHSSQWSLDKDLRLRKVMPPLFS